MNPPLPHSIKGFGEVIILLALNIILVSNCYTQIENTDLLERTTERLSEISDKPVDFSDFTDLLDHLQTHPINLNRTTPEELSQLSFLSDRQINNLLTYIQSYGTIYSLFELKVVDGFDSTTIMKILPYVTAGPEQEKHRIRLKELFSSGKNQLLITAGQVIQQEAGYKVPDSVLKKNPNSGYEGSPLKLNFRYSYEFYNRLSIGLSGQKDPGEQFFKGSELQGMDYYSGYVSLQNTGILKQLTMGNFNADFGQGLTLSSGISMGAIPGTGNLRRYGRGIVPSQSTNQGNYLRGGAIVLKKWNFRLSLFYSNHKRDGNITATDSSTMDALMVSSLTGTGYHRTPAEIQDKDAVRESIFGGNINFRNSFLSLGFTGFHSQWSASLEPKIHPYNYFYFRGTENLNMGIDFQVSLKNLFLFGEGAESRNSGLAIISGIQANPDPRFMCSLVLRNYEYNYQDLLSNALGQSSLNANEQGVLITVNAAILQGLVLTGYADLYRFPWLKYRIDAPSSGSEYQIETDYAAGKYIKFILRLRIRKKEINVKDEARPVNILEEDHSMSIRFQTDWNISNSLKLKTLFDWLRNKNWNSSPAYGYSFSQSVSLKPLIKHLSLSAAYSLFDTDSYNERIYNYENDVAYGYSVPAYSGNGLRFLVQAEWAVCKTILFSIRYGQSWYNEVNTIGTGLDLIKGNTKSELTTQLRFRF
jgi:hypothetical protein